jgi:hypothetical protein
MSPTKIAKPAENGNNNARSPDLLAELVQRFQERMRVLTETFNAELSARTG